MTRNGSSSSTWLAMIPLGVPVFMANIDLTVVNLALAQIANDLHVSLSVLQWIVNGYFIAAAAAFMLGTQMADRWGRRKMFIISTLIFIISSATAGMAQAPLLLILSRILQGIGMVVFPIAMAIVYATFPDKRRNLALGIITAVGGVSQALGPTLGGFILHALGWRWIFFINVPAGAFAIVAALLWVPRTGRQAGAKLDCVGQVFLSAGLLLVLCAFNEVQTWGCGSPAFIASLMAGVGLLAAFPAVERLVKHPMVAPDTFVNGPFWAANLIRALFQYVYFGIMFLIGLYLQNVLLFTPVSAGLTVLWMTAAVGLVAPLAAKCIDKFGCRPPIMAGLALMAAGFVLLSTTSTQSNLWEVHLSLLLLGVGAPAVFAGSVSATLSSVPEDRAGMASGVLYTNALIGGGVGVALTGLIIHSRAHAVMALELARQNLHLTPTQQFWLDRVVTGAHSADGVLSEFPASMVSLIMNDARNAFVAAFEANMHVYAVLCVIAMGLARFLPARALKLAKKPVEL